MHQVDEERDNMTDAQEERFNEIVVQLGANRVPKVANAPLGIEVNKKEVKGNADSNNE